MLGKKLTEKQVFELLSKGKTAKIKGFMIPGNPVPVDKKLVMDGTFNLELED
jgi:DNA topoisomerase-3